MDREIQKENFILDVWKTGFLVELGMVCQFGIVSGELGMD